MSQRTKFVLDEERIPRAWYNIVADLPVPPAAVLHPGTGQPIGPADLAQLRVNYHLARRFLYLIDGNAGEQVALAAQLGVTPAFLTPARIAALCNRQTGTVKY